jgi:hypothetical protein
LKLVTGRTLATGSWQFNIILINTVQYRFIAQFDNFVDDRFLSNFL